MLKIRDRHIDIDGELNDQHQQEGKRDGLEYQQNDDENRRHGEQVDALQVYIGRILQVFHHGSFADDEGARIPGLHYGVDLCNLVIYLRCCRLILRYHQSHLVLIALQHFQDVLGDHFPREKGPCQGGDTHCGLHALQIFNLRHDLPFCTGVKILIQENDMCRIHMEGVLQLFVCHIAQDIIRQ